VRTDLAAIPGEKTDENYVDAWLNSQLVEYERAVGKGVASHIFQSIEQGQRKCAKKRTIQKKLCVLKFTWK
jgi:hypothetical protein